MVGSEGTAFTGLRAHDPPVARRQAAGLTSGHNPDHGMAGAYASFACDRKTVAHSDM
jgi:hypothetical protein